MYTFVLINQYLNHDYIELLCTRFAHQITIGDYCESFMNICMYVSPYKHTYVYIYMYVCLYVCIIACVIHITCIRCAFNFFFTYDKKHI